METFPSEIWHLICQHLVVSDLSSLRLAGHRHVADVAAEYMIASVRIETSLESFKRLENIANHPRMRQNVKTVRYEAGLLADIGCFHAYKHHYETTHHDVLPQPQVPEKRTLRAMRYYTRETTKFQRELELRYEKYRVAFEEQRNVDSSVLPSILTKFKLQAVVLENGTVCAHGTSPQFKAKYCTDCAIPLSSNPAHTIWQFENIVTPGLRDLSALQVSLEIFNGQGGYSRDWLASRFSGLEKIRLKLVNPRSDDDDDDDDDDNAVRPMPLSRSLLPHALAAASYTLKNLSINFVISTGDRMAGSLDDLMTITFPQLRILDIDFLKTTQTSFVSLLKQQPKLKSLFIAFITLTDGEWNETARLLRYELSLDHLMINGFLEDPSNMYCTDFCDRDMWAIEGERYTLGMALDMYITDDKPHCVDDYNSVEEYDMSHNPLNRLDEFEDEAELEYEFGALSCSEDDDIDDGSDDNLSEIYGSNEDSPDLIDARPPSPLPMDVD